MKFKKPTHISIFKKPKCKKQPDISFSKNPIEVKIPKGSRGAYINKFSEKKNLEFEFLLDKNTIFNISDAGERTITVTKYDFKARDWIKSEEKEKFMILEVLK